MTTWISQKKIYVFALIISILTSSQHLFAMSQAEQLKAAEIVTALLRGTLSKIEYDLNNDNDKSSTVHLKKASISTVRVIHDALAIFNSPGNDYGVGHQAIWLWIDSFQCLTHGLKFIRSVVQNARNKEPETADKESSTVKKTTVSNPDLIRIRYQLLPETERWAGLLLAITPNDTVQESKRRFAAQALLSLSRACQILWDQEEGPLRRGVGVIVLLHLVHSLYQLLDQDSGLNRYLRRNEHLAAWPVPVEEYPVYPVPEEAVPVNSDDESNDLDDEEQEEKPQESPFDQWMRERREEQQRQERERRDPFAEWRREREERQERERLENERREQREREQRREYKQSFEYQVYKQAKRQRQARERQAQENDKRFEQQRQERLRQERRRQEQEAYEQRRQQEPQRQAQRQWREAVEQAERQHQERAHQNELLREALRREQELQRQRAETERNARDNQRVENAEYIKHFPHARHRFQAGDSPEEIARNAPWEILGVAQDAEFNEGRRRYYQLAREHHPDKHGGDNKFMTVVNVSYEEFRKDKE